MRDTPQGLPAGLQIRGLRSCGKIGHFEHRRTHLGTLRENIDLVPRGNPWFFELLGVEIWVQDFDFRLNLL